MERWKVFPSSVYHVKKSSEVFANVIVWFISLATHGDAIVETVAFVGTCEWWNNRQQAQWISIYRARHALQPVNVD